MSRRPNYAARRFLVFVVLVIVVMLTAWGLWAVEEYAPVHTAMRAFYGTGLGIRHWFLRTF